MARTGTLVVVLRVYVAVSMLCAALGVAALVYRAAGHHDAVNTLGPVLVVVGACATATAGLIMLAVLRRFRRD